MYLRWQGHPLMGEMVGTGCMTASVFGCFAAITTDHFEAAISAVNFYDGAGEQAAQSANRPMVYKAAPLDTIYELSQVETNQ
jgi:hydroxyethylthiazole kinase